MILSLISVVKDNILCVRGSQWVKKGQNSPMKINATQQKNVIGKIAFVSVKT